MGINIQRFLAFLALFVFFFLYQVVTLKPEWPQPDSVGWYINFAETLTRTGNFGYSGSDDKPSNVITPVYPAILSVFMLFDSGLNKTFRCFKFQSNRKQCKLEIHTILYFQYFLATLALFFIWLIAFEFTNKVSIAWLSMIVALLSGEFDYFAGQLLTENIILLFQCVFLFGFLRLLKSGKLFWFGISGINLGILTLIRPEYLYIFIFLPVLFLIFPGAKSGLMVRKIIVFCLSFLVLVAPWAVRNKHHFDSFALTSNYGERVLAQRLAFNRMSWAEWSVAFLYWFPDFGDNLTERLFPEKYYRKLNFSPESYYGKDAREITQDMRSHPDRDPIEYLVNEYVMKDMFKHVMVSLPLAWRGIFVAKYWGLIGAICLACCFLCRFDINRRLLFLGLLPVLPLLMLYAGVSVSIPRYYLALIPFYSVAMGVLVENLLRRIRDRINGIR